MDGIVSVMDVAHPYTAVCPTLDGEVLQVLVGTELGLTGREVAGMTGRRSHKGVLDSLHRLTAHGLVKRVPLNRAYLFTLNRDHIAAEAVELLMALRGKLFGLIEQGIRDWEISPVHASVFGSTARGDGGLDSDIDLLVVRPTPIEADEQRWQAQVDGLREQIEAWTGNRAAIVDISEPALAALLRQQRPIISELRTDAIAVYGADLTSLLDRQP
jgi:predicted nucleotidyltransferase